MISNRRLAVRAANAALVLLALFALCGVPGATARAQTAAPSPSTPAPMPSLTPATPYWRKVAEADEIFRGKIVSIKEEPPNPDFGRGMQRYRIEATCDETLKGAPQGKTVEFLYLPPDEPRYRAFVHGLARGRAVLFMYNFIIAATDEVVQGVRAEVKNQSLIAANFERLPAARPDRLHGRVKVLINILRDEKQEGAEGVKIREKALQYLRRLGPAGAPSVIRQLDDRRALPGDHVEFENGPNVFEAIRHGRPETVIELLAPFLPMMIGPGGLELSDRSAVAGWRVWLCYTMAEAEAGKKPANAKKPLQ